MAFVTPAVARLSPTTRSSFTSTARAVRTPCSVTRPAHGGRAAGLAMSAPSATSAATGAAATGADVMRILLPEKLSDSGIAMLSEGCEVVKDYDLTPERLLEVIGDYDAIIVRSATQVTREVLEAGTRLKVVGRAGVGVDNVCLPAATERGMLVVNAPTGNCVAAAEHSIALLCSLARNVAAADATLKAGGWNRGAFVGASLVGKTLGVLGFGRIGREVARRAKGLGMTVVAHDPYLSAESATTAGVTLASLDDTVAGADFLTLHMPLVDSTRNLLDARLLGLAKPGMRLINAARGGIVVEDALLAALESGAIAGAALDCFSQEPPFKFPDSVSAALAAHPRVVATPHLGASTKEAQEDVAIEIATAVKAALNGEMVPTMVNAPVISPEVLSVMRPRALLAERLGTLAHTLSGGNVSGDVKVTYSLTNDQEDTRLLRSAVIKGLMQPGLDVPINLVNADGVARERGLQVTEVVRIVDSTGDGAVSVEVKGAPTLEGRVINNSPILTRLGDFEPDLRLEGTMLCYAHRDQPGQIGKVGTYLGEQNINVSYMAVARGAVGAVALVMIGLDTKPPPAVISHIDSLVADQSMPPLLLEF
ncbi:hypothetical protein I4F81_012111 [Pyropia yezoensis]|uniref:Uncharacterized protein n=1 Tax=Pyropia yezoensis TaxID=2788 RepID=A0ACC3CH98_PYRYE|nr:hypothetical protein I4F81_012111 [Neopyropia yezoensis]|eukprot:contig_7756_g1825